MKVRFTVILLMTICHSLTNAYSFDDLSKSLTKTFTDVMKFIGINLNKINNIVFGEFKKKASQNDTVYDADINDSVRGYVSLEKPNSHAFQQLSTSQMARWHQRFVESYAVETKDGYILTLHRITNPRAHNRTVLLHHGLLGSSTDWIMLGPRKSLPYILADAGYDVWMTNARGNYYSRAHISLTAGAEEFWNFSFQEMGEYDLPAVIDHIREKNNNTTINFVGHSMGATALLVLLSTSPHYNEYLRMGVLLAPLAFMSYIRGPMKKMSSHSDDIIKTLGHGEYLPTRRVPSWLANKHCDGPKTFCKNPLLFLAGFPPNATWNTSFIAQLLYHIPAGGSTNTILHYLQIARNGKFHRFNDRATEFDLNNITLPLALLSSSEDWLASMTDVLKLYFLVQNPIDHHIIRNRNVTHTDFVWGKEASSLIFVKVLDYLENGLSWNMLKSNEVN